MSMKTICKYRVEEGVSTMDAETPPFPNCQSQEVERYHHHAEGNGHVENGKRSQRECSMSAH